MENLTDKQQLFVEHYLSCWNATKAARLAGYSDATACAIGSENLKKPYIQAYIAQRLESAAMGANEVLARLTVHARADIADLLDTEGNYKYDVADANNATGLITEIAPGEFGTKVKIVSSQQALIQLAKLHGLYVEKQEIVGNTQQSIRVEYVDTPPPDPASESEGD